MLNASILMIHFLERDKPDYGTPTHLVEKKWREKKKKKINSERERRIKVLVFERKIEGLREKKILTDVSIYSNNTTYFFCYIHSFQTIHVT